MVNYGQSKIYFVRNNKDDEVYVGSTCTLLCRRMSQHRCNAKRVKEGKSKITMRLYAHMNLIGIDEFYIEIYCEYPCTTKEQLKKKEGEIIRQFGTLNRCIAGRTKQEWGIENVERLKVTKREDYVRNKDKRQAQNKINQEKNKDKKRARDTEEIYCTVCKYSVQRIYFKGHLKTQKHLDNAQNGVCESEMTLCKVCNCMILTESLECHKLTQKHIDNKDKPVKSKGVGCDVCNCSLKRKCHFKHHEQSHKHTDNLKMIRDASSEVEVVFED